MRTNTKTSLAATGVSSFVASLIVIVMVSGCATTQVTGEKQFVTGKLPKPAHIWVYDFSATPADVPANSALAGQVAEQPGPQTAQQIAAGRELGAQIAMQLVQAIRDMGLPAMHGSAEAAPQINDIVIRGHLVSAGAGSEAQRVIIGFGAGASEMSAAVEGFQVTAQGLRPLGMGEVSAEGGKTPGTALGAITFLATRNPAGLIISGAMHAYGEESGKSTVESRAQQTAQEIGTVLKKRFQEQGWIND